jgi:hypothetical protein
LKTLPLMLPSLLRLRRQNRHKNISAAIRATPTIEPTTIPAMAPPDSPFLLSAAEAGALEDAGELVGEDVAEVEVLEGIPRERVGTKVGNTTPAHLLSAWEL